MVQGSAKRQSPGLVNFVPAVAPHFCKALPVAFRRLAQPCMWFGEKCSRKLCKCKQKSLQQHCRTDGQFHSHGVYHYREGESHNVFSQTSIRLAQHNRHQTLEEVAIQSISYIVAQIHGMSNLIKPQIQQHIEIFAPCSVVSFPDQHCTTFSPLINLQLGR